MQTFLLNNNSMKGYLHLFPMYNNRIEKPFIADKDGINANDVPDVIGVLSNDEPNPGDDVLTVNDAKIVPHSKVVSVESIDVKGQYPGFDVYYLMVVEKK